MKREGARTRSPDDKDKYKYNDGHFAEWRGGGEFEMHGNCRALRALGVMVLVAFGSDSFAETVIKPDTPTTPTNFGENISAVASKPGDLVNRAMATGRVGRPGTPDPDPSKRRGGVGGGGRAQAISDAGSNQEVWANADATGGTGGPGASPNGLGGDGGSAGASAISNNTGSGNARADAFANGASGAFGAGPDGSGGRGATAGFASSVLGVPRPVWAASANGNATATATASGGNGGPGSGTGSSGSGAAVSLLDAVGAKAPGRILVRQTANGGDGGIGQQGGMGIAGSATSALELGGNGADAVESRSLQVFTVANGGGGGARQGGAGSGGAGAAARSSATAINNTGDAVASGIANGGPGGTGILGASGGAGGIARASAVAEIRQSGTALAVSNATGGQGGFGAGSKGATGGASATSTAKATGNSGWATARASAGSNGSATRGVLAGAQAPVASTVSAFSHAATSGSPIDPALVQGMQAYALGVGGSGGVFGSALIGAAYPGDGSGSRRTFNSFVDFELDTAQIVGPEILEVAFGTPMVQGNGFDALIFAIRGRNGGQVQRFDFTDVGAALAFFSAPLLLSWNDFVFAGQLDVGFELLYTSNDAGAGFGVGLEFGNGFAGVPEPASLAMLALALLALAIAGSSGRRLRGT